MNTQTMKFFTTINTVKGELLTAKLITPVCNKVILGGRFSEIQIWNLSDEKLIKTIPTGVQFVLKIAISPNGQILAYAD